MGKNSNPGRAHHAEDQYIVTAEVHIHGCIESQEARDKFRALADTVCEPVLIGKKYYETKDIRNAGTLRGGLPIITVAKSWQLFDEQTIYNFWKNVLDIKQEYHIHVDEAHLRRIHAQELWQTSHNTERTYMLYFSTGTFIKEEARVPLHEGSSFAITMVLQKDDEYFKLSCSRQ